MAGTAAAHGGEHSDRAHGSQLAVRALVVDDEPDVRALHARLLRERDVSVSEAADGAQAVQHLAGERFDLVLLDVNMPKLDGPGVLRHLGGVEPSRRPRLVVVVSTTGRTAELMGLGADAIYPKPLTRERVEQVLRSLASGQE